MAKLPDSFIDNLLSRVDLVEIIGARVPLKKQGKDYSARCPFHDERSPSFTVSPSKQFYYCFGCGASGDARCTCSCALVIFFPCRAAGSKSMRKNSWMPFSFSRCDPPLFPSTSFE